MRLLSLICAGLIAASPLAAQDRETLGTGRLFTNDYFGDTQDRWRTGSYTYSIVRGTGWEGRAPTPFGALLEYRLRSEIISPSVLSGPGSKDRPYVGALSAGLHTHFALGGSDVSAGVDLVAVGPQTGLAKLQDEFHDLVSVPSVSKSVRDNQVADAIHPTALAALAYPVQVTRSTTVRPFVEAQYGVENYLRVGADILIGEMLQKDLWLRDGTSGQLYTGVESPESGYAFVLGADYAMLDDSAYFPASFGTVAEDERFRARAGVHWRFGGGISYFYGVTYLSEEYVGQSKGQIVGSLKLNFNF